MGEIKQYECPKCGYKPPILHFGCGFHLSYEVYVCRVCKTLQSSLCHILVAIERMKKRNI